MRYVIKTIILSAIFLMLSTVALATPNVEVYFSPAVQTAERNAHFLVSVMASTDADIHVDGLDANVNYDRVLLRDAVVKVSNIGGWMVSLEDNAPVGRIIYQKGGNAAGETMELLAGVPKILCVLEFKVSSDAALVTTSLTFQKGFINLTAQGYSGDSISTYNSAQIGILPDIVAPLTMPAPPGGLYNTQLYVTLAQDPSDRAADLREIHYTIADHPGITANMLSPVYDQPVYIPVETTRYISFFGVDNYNNIEPARTVQYRVDIQPPQIGALLVTPGYCRSGQRVAVSFTVNEPIQGGVPLSVDLGTLPMVVSDNTWPDYAYYYDIQGTETEGTHDLQIILKDTAGNQTVDTRKSLTFDFTPPRYFNPRLSAQSPSVVYLEFVASELIDTLNTAISVSANPATYISNIGTTYHYRYNKLGTEESCLIKVDGYDLAGNFAENTLGWNVVTVRGRDVYNNLGERSVTTDIVYPVAP
jgi:hypothetical protein